MDYESNPGRFTFSIFGVNFYHTIKAAQIFGEHLIESNEEGFEIAKTISSIPILHIQKYDSFTPQTIDSDSLQPILYLIYQNALENIASFGRKMGIKITKEMGFEPKNAFFTISHFDIAKKETFYMALKSSSSTKPVLTGNTVESYHANVKMSEGDISGLLDFAGNDPLSELRLRMPVAFNFYPCHPRE